MATIEDAVQNLERVLTEDYPAMLKTVEAEHNDGIRLEPLRKIEWEEVRDAAKVTPLGLIIGVEETDPVDRDQVRDATILLYIVLTDKAKSNLTKKIYRYADAVRRVLRPATNRTLRGTIISAKVLRVRYLPTFVSRDQLFARDLEATIVLRIPRGGN